MRAESRWSIVLAIALFGGGSLAGGLELSHAKPSPDRAAATPTTFWRELVEPNADEVAVLLRKARETMLVPDDQNDDDVDWAVDQRARFFVDAFHLLRYARTLAPRDVDVLVALGEAADELGKTREAIDALKAAIEVAGPTKLAAATGRLGAIQLRLGKFDDAVRWLGHAQADGGEGAPLVHLAHAYAARGERILAIETLIGGLPEKRLAFSPGLAIVAFSLAVHYDQEEQRGAAFEILEQLTRLMQQSYNTTLKTQIAALRLPGADPHYYRALLYESLMLYVEARAEWALYAAFPDARYRARAHDHIARIDAHQRATKPVRPSPARGTVPPPPIRRRLPRGP